MGLCWVNRLLVDYFRPKDERLFAENGINPFRLRNQICLSPDRPQLFHSFDPNHFAPKSDCGICASAAFHVGTAFDSYLFEHS
jgi:hypothetical protein